MNESQIPIADALEALRSELERAMSQGEGHSLRFQPSSVELELQATVGVASEASGGVKWWLLDFGAKGTHESGATQKVTLRLTPTILSAEGSFGPALLEGDD